jgi:tricorn protease
MLEAIRSNPLRRLPLMKRCAIALVTFYTLAAAANAQTKEPILLANNPALSPDGSMLAFDWNGDIWTIPVTGGVARQMTQHPARDREPKFSPDGKEIAFTSERDGSWQVYVMPAEGGTPRQLTHHTAGYSLQGWLSDGKGLLVSSARDHYWRHAERFFRISCTVGGPEELLFDDYGQNGALSPDGKRLLFTREGPSWWRKGYHGSQASQIWQYDGEKTPAPENLAPKLELGSQGFTKLVSHDHGCCWPLWKPDGKGFYYVGGQSGSFNLWERDLESGQERQLTKFQDDSVVFPCISRDGSTIVFRYVFDLYRFRPGSSEPPRKIDVFSSADRVAERKVRRLLQQASQVAFSQDGLEVAFIAGGDLWVMDTELREPRQVTATAEEESSPAFSPEGDSILFVSDMNGQTDLWGAKRADEQKYWWQNENFKLERLTTDGEVKSQLKWSPDGSRVAFIRGRGDVWVMDPDGKNAKLVLQSWDRPEYDWSPDGKWLVYAVYDNDFNRDIWLTPVDGSRKPFNLSRHPYNEHSPVWSPDGRVIAFTGRRAGPEMDIYFVWLRAEDDEKQTRDRTLEKALEKIKKVRQPGAQKSEPGSPDPQDEPGDDPPAPKTDTGAPAGKNGAKRPGLRKQPVPAVVIDFDRIHERIRRVPISDSTVSNLFWSHDSKKLAFTATVDGQRATHTIEIPDNLRPKVLSTQTGTQARWLKQGNQIVWLVNGVPASLPQGPGAGGAGRASASLPAAGRGGRGGVARPSATPAASTEAAEGGGTTYRFQALQEVDVEKKQAAAFDLCWRTMRDQWYDERLGNRDWNAIRRKYIDVAAKAPDADTLATVIQLMLGELNGSHLGFTTSPRAAAAPPGRRRGPAPAEPETPSATTWSKVTPHLGVRFQVDYQGPGLKVRDVLPDGPADHQKSRILPGEIFLSIDGRAIEPATDLTGILNGPLARDIHVKVRNAEGKDREVTLRPISYTLARSLLYEKWVKDNRKKVEESSQGTLGYLHISGMNISSFHRFEEELYSVGVGKDGLIIDVRENGGGSTADHLLTALSQPVHALTVPRGGGPGYPQDRKVYATWNKPIVVLCNQNSFSNAEIFSHAIKTLKRGQLVGVPTAGGVVSTGGTQIMDVGFLRLPFRGWFLIGDGEDMELNGAVPDHIVWPEPGQMPQGKDVQLDKAVAVLSADVKAWKQRPQPAPRKATQREQKGGLDVPRTTGPDR